MVSVTGRAGGCIRSPLRPASAAPVDARRKGVGMGDRRRVSSTEPDRSPHPTARLGSPGGVGNRTARRASRLLTWLLPALLLACTSPPPAPKDRFFPLAAQPPVTLNDRARPTRATLIVRNLSARGFLGGRQIVFRTEETPLETKRYPTLLWEEPPARALSSELATALRDAGLFAMVLDARQGTRGDYALGGELRRFEHLPSAGGHRVAMDFTLTLVDNAERRALMSRRYRGDEPTDKPTPEAMVRAFNRLSARLIGEFIEDLDRRRSGLGKR